MERANKHPPPASSLEMPMSPESKHHAAEKPDNTVGPVRALTCWWPGRTALGLGSGSYWP